MDLFKFTGNSTTPFQEAQLIQGADSKTWIERFRDFGEFSIEAPTSSGFQQTLPIGTFVSHVDADEVMIVENHEIKDEEGKEDQINISGRSLDAFMQERIVGSNFDWSTINTIPQLTLPTNTLRFQIVSLINLYIQAAGLSDDDDEFLNVEAVHLNPPVGESVRREIQIGSLHQRVLELLEIEDLGIKVVRPGPDSPLASYTDVALAIHGGKDLTQKVSFSFDSGDLNAGQYLWTSKRRKTSALVQGTWLTAMVHGPETHYDRRTMLVSAPDVDEAFEELPSGTDRTEVIEALEIRGRQALAAQNNTAIISVEVARDLGTHRYRKDYDIGDIVAVEGNYSSETTMRVIEHVEIEDETGETSYPTLSLVGSD